MRRFYFLLLLSIIITGCQQQQVPETLYDLEGQSITSQTREMQRSILYQVPKERVLNQPIKIFDGYVLERIKNQKNVRLKIQNDNGELLMFEIEEELANQLRQNMELIVRYSHVKGEVVVVEIRKKS
ncbi:hypothetical protein [Aureispira anguillae]|uniref:Lipoprotein n=1 Tax=Aureispira anguillae TaxID=2864201 RepID=A0A915YJS4_9BACT|nr:hypothetical protein [Aureispira anguillae]BDS14503.1 hypothetical protein AsAng_0052830 [Aureispira anguillae]